MPQENETLKGGPTKNCHIWWELFFTFLKIGLISFGGGYVMLPFIERAAIYDKKWIDEKECLDMIAISQSAPGVMAINSAVAVGYRAGGVVGALAASLGVVLPAFTIVGLISLVFLRFEENRYLTAFFKGVRPVVVMMIIMAAINTGKKAVTDKVAVAICGFSLAGLLLLRLHPILLIGAAGLFGIFYQPLGRN